METSIQKTTNLELIISETELAAASKIDSAVSTLINSNLNGLAYTVAKTRVVTLLGDYLNSDVMKPVVELQGKKYGFLIDLKGEDKYRESVVKDCFIEAILNGVEPTGNQFNIIASRCYITKEGCTHKLKKNGVQTFVSFLPSYQTGEIKKVTYIPTTIDWVLPNGEKGSRTIEFPIRTFDSTTESAIRGMAERDIKAWLIEELTGKQLAIGDANEKPISTTIDGGYAQEVKENVIKEKVPIIDTTNCSDVEALQVVSKELQERFDKHISKATTLEGLESRTTGGLEALGIKNINSFNLDTYNKLKKSFNS